MSLTIEEAEKKEAQKRAEERALYSQHKPQFDCLPTFSSKLQFFLKNISSFPSPTVFRDGENGSFTLALDPQTDDDRRKLHRVMMDYHRNELAGRKEPVRKLGWQYSPQDPKPIAFEIQLFDTLKEDLASRITTSVRKEDFLQRELELTTAKIDSAGWPFIEELRDILDTKRTYDFAFTDKPFSSPSDEACQLAFVWDIVHYEAYLKDESAQLKKGNLLSNTSNSDADITKYQTFSDLFIRPDDIRTCVDALRQVEPPVVSDIGTWIGGSRKQSVIVAWIDVLEQRGKIKKLSSRIKLSELLNAYFQGLQLDTNTASIFSKFTTTRNAKHVDFLRLIK